MTFDTRAPLSIQSARTINVGRGSGALPTIVWDGFESADMSAPDGPAPYLNNGFSWAPGNRTSVVTRNEDGNVVVWNNGPIYNINNDPPERDWTAKTGDHCLRFRYPPGGNMAEQRFSLTDAYPELWMSFWVRIPVNFNLISGQTKFFSIWMDGYSASGQGSTVFMDYRPNGDMGITHTQGGNTVSVAYLPRVNVFDPVNDRGVWFKFVVRVVAESQPGASDGIMQVWHKRRGDEDLVLSHEAYDWRLKIPEDGPQGWAAGYLLGYVNNPYEEETEWLLDDFKLSIKTLIED